MTLRVNDSAEPSPEEVTLLNMSTEFNREMITLGRQLLGLTRTQLAKRCGMSQSHLTRVENGDRILTEEIAASIAEALDRPIEFLRWDGELFAGSHVFHRRRASTRVRDVEKTNAHINFTRLRVLRMMDGINLKVRRKMHRIAVTPTVSPSDAARQLRSSWQVPPGPIANLVDLVESAGIVVWETDQLASEVDALSLWPIGEEETTPVVVRVSGKSGDRERFTLAHELGHLCLHHQPAEDFEAEANQFASEFLMPKDDIIKSLRQLNLSKAAALKGKWKVSMQAIIRRAYDLKVISESQYRNLNRELSAKGYKKREPVLIPSETPRLRTALVDRFTKKVDSAGLRSPRLGASATATEADSVDSEQQSEQSSKPTLRLFADDGEMDQ
ncbi:helix-turn-helix protein [Rubripirellula lacrimiformis]|uniref:Helix-turn-helix protein n=2 Tax=Rubripirellula lacrimiformis TaxID=1930273 RepID=A0A517NK43_9BACT|nr:helix-turn-helix protein [Rubripirellula lacrimiformis]